VWSGALLAMYSAGNKEPCKTPADFDWFEYQPEPCNQIRILALPNGLQTRWIG
jgi:hypothetical protein